MQTFEVEARLIDGTPTLQLRGDADTASASQLRQALRRLPDGEVTVIDLRHVPFMDSAGLGALVCGFRELRDRGGNMAAVVGRGPVRRLFEVTGFDRLIPMGRSLDEARQALSPAAEKEVAST